MHLVCVKGRVTCRVLSDCCTSITFALGFHVRALGVADGADGMRSGGEHWGLRRGVRQAGRAALQRELERKEARAATSASRAADLE